MRRFPLLVVLALCLGPASTALASVTVTRGPVNIRSGPSTDHPVVGQAKVGETFEDLSKTGDWYKVRLKDGSEGYLHSSLVQYEKTAAPNTFVITKGAMNVRSKPGTANSVVAQVPAGAVLPVSSMADQWAKVTVGDKTGYIAGWLCTVKVLDAQEFESGDVARRVIALANVVVRRGASEDYDVLATLRTGAQVEYLGSSDGWHRVRTSSGIIGWVYAADVKVANVNPGQGVMYEVGDDYWEMRVTPTGRSKGTTNVRKSGSTSTAIVGKLSQGQSFTVLDTRNGWHQIQAGKLTGWVASYLVTLDSVQGPSKVRLEKGQTVKTLTISGQFPLASLAALDSLNLGIVAVPRVGTRGNIEVYAGEVGTLQFGQAGVMVTFLEKPSYKIIENKPGLVRLQFSSTIEAISYAEGPKTSVAVDMLGFPEIDSSFDTAKGLLTVDLIGASLKNPPSIAPSGPVTALGATQHEGYTAITVQVAAGSQYNLRRTPNRLAIDVLPKGLQGKVITIDPGHGGTDPGAIGAQGLYEKIPNLTVALRVRDLLQSCGAKVIMTRTTDAEGPTLADRVKVTLDSQSDALISIHNNSNPNRTKNGISVYFAESSLNAERSQALGRALQTSLVAALGRQDLGVKSSELFVCRTAPVTAVVAEIVFVSYPEEESKLQDPVFLEAASQAIFAGVRQHFGE